MSMMRRAGKSFGLREFITLEISMATLCVNSSQARGLLPLLLQTCGWTEDLVMLCSFGPVDGEGTHPL